MTNEYPPISTSALAVSPDPGRKLRYLMLGVAANAFIWGTVFYFLKDSPRSFTSRWSVMLLGTSGKSGASTSAENSNPLLANSAPSSDVKASYRVIATTDSVCKAAAAKLGITPEQFGKAQVEIVDGTALMNFAINGSTREEAQKKAYAFNESFQERLNQLRFQQAEEQETGFENSLGVARKKLETAQLRLSDYKVKAGLASKDQIDQLASNIESLRRLRAEIVAQQQEASVRARQLTVDLKMSSRLAAEAFILRADPLFQQYSREYGEATANLTNLANKFGANHPVVVRETARQTAMEKALLERGQLLLGRAVDAATIAQLSLGGNNQSGNARESLFKDIVTSETDRQGLAARIQELDRQLYQLEQRLSILAQRSSTLDALSRDTQIAEAIFSSRLAGLNANASSIFSSYPAIQMVAEPSMPERGVIPRQRPFFTAAAIASMLVTLGLIVLWLRKVPLPKLWFKRSSSF